MRFSVIAFFAALLIGSGLAPALAQNPEITPECRSGPADQSIEACGALLSRKPPLSTDDQARTFMFLGDAYARKRDFDQALVEYDAAVRLAPHLPGPYNQRGLAWRQKGEYDRAIADYTIAIKINPKIAIYFANRGVAYRWRGDFDKAIADQNVALSLDPGYAPAWMHRAVVHRFKSDFVRALADHNESIRLAPKAVPPVAERAVTHESKGDFRASLADFRKAQELAPRNEKVQRAIARVEGRIAEGGAPPSPGQRTTDAARPPAAGPAAGRAAAPEPGRPSIRSGDRRVALIIGNSRYTAVSPLSNPKNDAETLGTSLRNLGFGQVTLKFDLSREQLLEALKSFSREADKADWAVIYFAGHGVQIGGINYVLPIDAKLAAERDVTFEAVALEQVLDSVEGARKLRIVILDACRDNPFVPTMKKSAGSTRSVGKGLANVEPEGATLVAYAAKHGQTAEDGQGGNSPFMAALVKNLPTPGLEINLLFRKVRDDVLAATGKRQEPFTYGSLPSEALYFRAK